MQHSPYPIEPDRSAASVRVGAPRRAGAPARSPARSARGAALIYMWLDPATQRGDKRGDKRGDNVRKRTMSPVGRCAAVVCQLICDYGREQVMRCTVRAFRRPDLLGELP